MSHTPSTHSTIHVITFSIRIKSLLDSLIACGQCQTDFQRFQIRQGRDSPDSQDPNPGSTSRGCKVKLPLGYWRWSIPAVQHRYASAILGIKPAAAPPVRTGNRIQTYCPSSSLLRLRPKVNMYVKNKRKEEIPKIPRTPACRFYTPPKNPGAPT